MKHLAKPKNNTPFLYHKKVIIQHHNNLRGGLNLFNIQEQKVQKEKKKEKKENGRNGSERIGDVYWVS